MTKHRSIARHAFLLLIALSLSGCLSDAIEIQDETAAEEPLSNANAGGVSLSITAPVSSSEMGTSDDSVNLSGIAKSDLGIYRVSWSNDHGDTGIASGTSSWKTGSIGLELGDNVITVTAENTAGKTNSRTIKVKRESRQKGSVTLSWSPPESRVDGSPLTNLAGYKIDYGLMSGVYDYEIDVSNAGVMTYVVENLSPGEWFFAVAAYDAEGLESDPSNEVARTIN